MPVQSMTGFGRGQAKNDNMTVTVELKSVNHRYKDLRFKASSLFAFLEPELRRQIGQFFARGSFDVSLQYTDHRSPDINEVLNLGKVKTFVQQFEQEVMREGQQLNLRPTDFLRNEFAQDSSENLKSDFRELTPQAFQGACEELRKQREEEGKKLVQVLLEHLQNYRKSFGMIEQKSKDFERETKERILNKFKEYEAEIQKDEGRFHQEMIYYLEKVDIHEEMDRIHSHLSKVESTLKNDQEVGRGLDFLMQELNRETNTIGSKSNHQEISDIVVKLKIFIEKMREQALNLQ